MNNFDNHVIRENEAHDDEIDELLDGILYFAAPKHIYNTIKFNAYISKIFADNPLFEIKIAKYEFGSNDHWKSIWLSLAPLIDKLIFVSDDDSFIGLGVWSELRTVLPTTEIVYLSPNFEYVSINKLAVQIYNDGNCWKHFAKVNIVTTIGDE